MVQIDEMLMICKFINVKLTEDRHVVCNEIFDGDEQIYMPYSNMCTNYNYIYGYLQ